MASGPGALGPRPAAAGRHLHGCVGLVPGGRPGGSGPFQACRAQPSYFCPLSWRPERAGSPRSAEVLQGAEPGQVGSAFGVQPGPRVPLGASGGAVLFLLRHSTSFGAQRGWSPATLPSPLISPPVCLPLAPRRGPPWGQHPRPGIVSSPCGRSPALPRPSLSQSWPPCKGSCWSPLILPRSRLPVWDSP